MSKPELLSPAGSYESLCAAVQSGADAVYLGGSSFGARKSAKNFTIEEMKKWTDYCHIYGVSVYVTVNTLVKDNEKEELAEYVRTLSDIGVDAVLLQDFGAVEIVKKCAPQLAIHASTQMTATSADDVLFLQELGFERVVLSRELSFEQIREIAGKVTCELEVFVHGAICMCYSGQCLFSSIVGGRSGNRGACAQPCRLPYSIVDSDGKKVCGGYMLSPRDLCLVSRLDDLAEIGVKSLKIEGRLKRCEYVAAVTGIYRKYIDNPSSVLKSDITELKNAFARGFTTGLFGGEGAKMINPDNPSNAASNTFTADVKKRCADGACIRKIPVEINASVRMGDKLCVCMTDGENYAYAASDSVAERAISVSLTDEKLKESLKKLGNTPYECRDIQTELDENISIPVSQINLVRRRAQEELSRLRAERPLRQTFDFDFAEKQAVRSEEFFIACDVSNAEQAAAAEKLGIKRIYCPENVNTDGGIIKCAAVTSADNCGGDFLAVSNAGQIKKHSGKQLFGGARLNITNSESLLFYSRYLNDAILSPELNLREIGQMSKCIPVGIIAYGRLDLMICRACPLKNAGLCQNHKAKYRLRDRMGNVMPLVCTSDCSMRILNSKPIYMADKAEEIKKSGVSFAVLKFTDETGSECEKIISDYISAFSGNGALGMTENTFTRGHFYRGVK